jgi:hypothetical protein
MKLSLRLRLWIGIEEVVNPAVTAPPEIEASRDASDVVGNSDKSCEVADDPDRATTRVPISPCP